MTPQQKGNAIRARNELLREAQETLRETVGRILLELAEKNRLIFDTTEEADRTTQQQVYELLQDRATEAAFGHGIYRH